MSFDPGGGTIASEGDVALSNPANGQTLTYDTGIAKWSNHTFTATDVGALSGIESPTAPSSPVTDQLWYDSTNDLLKRWDGAAWVTGSTAGSTTLAGDTDVAISSPATGQVLTYDETSTKWKNQAVPAAPVSSVAGKTGAVTLVEGDVASLVSDLAAKVPTTRTLTTGTGLSGGGDLSADRTLSVTSDSTTQKIEVAKDGTLQGTRKRINFVAGSNISISTTDDTVNNKVDVTITASTASSPQRIISWEDAGDGSTLAGVQAASGLTFIRTARTASEVAVALDAAPTAGPVTYQINKNGSSWLTISVSTGQTTATTTTFSNGAALAVGDTFTVARTAGDSTPTQANIVITGA